MRKRRLPPRDRRGRFTKQAPPLPDDLLKQLGFGQVRVGNVVIPINRAVLADVLDEHIPWVVVDRGEKG